MFGVTARAKRTRSFTVGYQPINILAEFKIGMRLFLLAQLFDLFPESKIFLFQFGSRGPKFHELFLGLGFNCPFRPITGRR